MQLSAPCGQMIVSKCYPRTAHETGPAFVDHLSRKIRVGCLKVLADLLPGEYVLPPERKGFSGVPSKAADAFVQSRREPGAHLNFAAAKVFLRLRTKCP